MLEEPTNSTVNGELEKIPNIFYYVVSSLEFLIMLIVIVSNLFVVVTAISLKRSHDPHNRIVIALGVTDFFVGAWAMPMYILAHLPETWHLVRSNEWLCKVSLSSTLTQGLSLSLLTLMCVDMFIYIKDKVILFLKYKIY